MFDYDYGMFSPEGSAKVDEIVAKALAEHPANAKAACAYAEDELDALSNEDGFPEAFDTAVREAVYGTLLLKILPKPKSAQLEEAFDDACDEATHAVIEAFGACIALPCGDERTALLYRINDAITAIMQDYR